MGWFNEQSSQAAIEKCGIDAKYPVIKDNMDGFRKILYQGACRYSSYQRIAKRFLSQCTKYIRKPQSFQVSFEQHVALACVRDLRKFRIYLEHDITDFKSTKFVEDFCGRSIATVLDCFAAFNMNNDINYQLRKNNTIYDHIVKILNIHLMMFLAKCFSIYEVTMMFDTPELLSYININDEIGIYKSSLNQYIILGLQQGRNLQEIIDTSDSDYVIEISQKLGWSELIVQGFVNFLGPIHETLNKLLHFFANKSNTEILHFCAQNPDFDATLGKFFTGHKNLSKDQLIKIISNIEYSFLGKILPTNLVINEDSELVSDLKLPQLREKKYQDLVIEI